MIIIITALIALQVKHFICDYPLQSQVMLGKFRPYPDFIFPLAYHSAIQALGTLVLVVLFRWPIWFILLDFVTHFIIDRLKASPDLLGRYKSDNKYFWWALGFDQFLHHIVGIFMVWYAYV